MSAARESRDLLSCDLLSRDLLSCDLWLCSCPRWSPVREAGRRRRSSLSWSRSEPKKCFAEMFLGAVFDCFWWQQV